MLLHRSSGHQRTSHLEDAAASLDIALTDDEVARLEAPYTPLYDFQGMSDDDGLTRICSHWHQPGRFLIRRAVAD
jgi:hypothetical protein